MISIDMKKIGMFLGPLVTIIMLQLSVPEGMSPLAWKTASIAALMAIWWITEALPLAATALLPIVLFPAMGIMTPGQTTPTYASPVIFLFMGGFLLAVTMERWNLHRRIALKIISIVGTSPSMMILGFMGAVGVLSLVVSNTATAVMMVPIGIAVIGQVSGSSVGELLSSDDKRLNNFAKSLMLCIAYSASVGGVSTIIATPPNMIFVGLMESLYGLKISFIQWMFFGIPLMLFMMVVIWVLLTQVLLPTKDLRFEGGDEAIKEQLGKLGPMTTEEKKIICVAAIMVAGWLFRGLIDIKLFKMINDGTIAIFGAMLLFIIPTNFKENRHLLDWATAVKIPWGIILLFGGGLTLANGFDRTGLATWISNQLKGLEGTSLIIFVLVVVLVVLAMTEMASNTATATLFVPIMGSIAIAMGVHPYATALAACIAASFCFMLPVATPPNAIVFASGYLEIKDMVRAGIYFNIISVFVITGAVMYFMPLVWGIDLSHTPAEVLEFIEAAKITGIK